MATCVGICVCPLYFQHTLADQCVTFCLPMSLPNTLPTCASTRASVDWGFSGVAFLVVKVVAAAAVRWRLPVGLVGVGVFLVFFPRLEGSLPIPNARTC